MRQYFDAKRQYRHALVFFRMGDFYEMFYEDALVASRALDLTLTSRSKDASGTAVPMCGVPFHAADGYIARLVKKGYRVAICEQVEDPKKAKGVVKREVVRVVSPGTLTDAGYLDAREPAFLMAIVAHRRRAAGARRRDYGVALVDLSTGEFDVAEYSGPGGPGGAARRNRGAASARDRRRGRLRRRARSMPEIAQIGAAGHRNRRLAFRARGRAADAARSAARAAASRASASSGVRPAVCAGGALVRHLRDTQKADLAHVRTIRLRQTADGLLIDPTTLKHLEIVRGDGRRPRRIAARRDRSHGHADGRPAAAHLAAAPADRARADPRSARRRRRAGGPDHRARQGCARR